MEKINLDDLATASFAYYIVSYSDEEWADKSYKKFFIDCGDSLADYLEKSDKGSVAKIVNAVVEFLKSWHSLRAGGARFEKEFKQFLLNDKNITTFRMFSKKVFLNSTEQDFRNAGEFFELIENVHGVGPTNSSKILHLFSPNFFMIWDQRIRETLTKHKNYREGDYADFLKATRERISELTSTQLEELLKKLKPLEIENVKKTIPKLIDEYNFITITKGMNLKDIREIANTIFLKT